MNKTTLTLIGLGSIILCAIFFTAGFFFAAPPKGDLAQIEAEKLLKLETDKKKTEEEGKKDIKDQVSDILNNNIFYKKEKISLSIPVDRPTTTISIETILQEIDHNAEVENEKKGILNKFASGLAENEKIIVFVGYFNTSIAPQIINLLTAHGYQANSAVSKNSSEEIMIFCGPITNKNDAEKLLDWLKTQQFQDARIIYTQETQTNYFKVNPIDQEALEKQQTANAESKTIEEDDDDDDEKEATDEAAQQLAAQQLAQQQLAAQQLQNEEEANIEKPKKKKIKKIKKVKATKAPAAPAATAAAATTDDEATQATEPATETADDTKEPTTTPPSTDTATATQPPDDDDKDDNN